MSEPAPRRVLLDENVDRLIQPLFGPGLDVVTVRERGWDGLQNGVLLRAAADEFDVFVTMDRNLPFQQNLAALDLAIGVIRSVSNASVDVAPLMPQIDAAVRNAEKLFGEGNPTPPLGEVAPPKAGSEGVGHGV